jgi:hypothetical protein
MITDINIIPDAMRFTMDSRASERRATDPERVQATSFIAKMSKPPARAVKAALLFLNSQSIPPLSFLGVSTDDPRTLRVVKAYGGAVTFETDPEKGTTCTL